MITTTKITEQMLLDMPPECAATVLATLAHWSLPSVPRVTQGTAKDFHGVGSEPRCGHLSVASYGCEHCFMSHQEIAEEIRRTQP